MQSPLQSSVNPVATTIALSVAPAAAGAGIGILLAETLDRHARRAAAVTLLGLAVLAVTPLLTSLVKRQVTGPKSRRGNAKTLQQIRDGAVGDLGYEDFNFDEFEADAQGLPQS